MMNVFKDYPNWDATKTNLIVTPTYHMVNTGHLPAIPAFGVACLVVMPAQDEPLGLMYIDVDTIDGDYETMINIATGLEDKYNLDFFEAYLHTFRMHLTEGRLDRDKVNPMSVKRTENYTEDFNVYYKLYTSKEDAKTTTDFFRYYLKSIHKHYLDSQVECKGPYEYIHAGSFFPIPSLNEILYVGLQRDTDELLFMLTSDNKMM